MQELGNRTEDSIIDFKWSSNAAAGGSITRATNGTVSVYKENSVTQTTVGITDTEDFDSLTGIHHCRIDSSADAFYEVGKDYQVVLSAATIDGQTVNAVLAHFRIEYGFAEVDVVKLLGSAIATPTVAGVIEADVTHQLGVAATGAGGRLEGNTTHWGGTAVASAVVNANAMQISGDGPAADAWETMLDGTGGNTLTLGRFRISAADASPAFWVTNSGDGDAVKFHNTSLTGPGMGMLVLSENGFGCEFTSAASYAFVCDGLHGALFNGSGASGDAIQMSVAGTGKAINVLSSAPSTLNTVTMVLGANAIVASSVGADAFTAAKFASDVGTEFAAAVWDKDATGHQTQGSFGQVIGDSGADTNTIWGVLNSGTHGNAALNTDLDALLLRLTSTRAGYLDNLSVGAVALQASVDDLEGRLTATRAGYLDNLSAGAVALASVLGAPAGASIAADVAAVKVDTAAVKAKTDNLPTSPAAVGSAMTLTSGERDALIAALLDLADGIETGRTPRQAARLILSALTGKLSGAATPTISIRDTNDTKNRIVATVDADGNRSAVVLDGT
jgi:hypothetical protein